jgi:hypothetical protein
MQQKKVENSRPPAQLVFEFVGKSCIGVVDLQYIEIKLLEPGNQ